LEPLGGTDDLFVREMIVAKAGIPGWSLGRLD